MPLKKKVTRTNTGGYMISLPKQWVDELTRKHGEELKEILMEVNGELKITPILSTNTSHIGVKDND